MATITPAQSELDEPGLVAGTLSMFPMITNKLIWKPWLLMPGDPLQLVSRCGATIQIALPKCRSWNRNVNSTSNSYCSNGHWDTDLEVELEALSLLWEEAKLNCIKLILSAAAAYLRYELVRSSKTSFKKAPENNCSRLRANLPGNRMKCFFGSL